MGRLLLPPSLLVKLHVAHTLIWLLLIAPSLLWWRESVPWLVTMSVWANVAGSLASVQAARADCNSPTSEDLKRLERKVDRLLRRAA